MWRNVAASFVRHRSLSRNLVVLRSSLPAATTESSTIIGSLLHPPEISRIQRQWMSSEDGSKTPANGENKEAAIEQTQTTEETLASDTANEATHPPESLQGSREEYTEEIVIKMPDMGEGNENKIETWFKQPGDVIKRNDVLCDISTPDFTFGMVTEDSDDAIMGEIHVQEGEVADDNAPICTTWHRPEE